MWDKLSQIISGNAVQMLNTMQVLEDDEEYQNPVDLLFEELAKKKPNSFAGRQYKLYKLAAGGVPPSGGIARNAWTQGKELDGFDVVPPLPRQ